ncbi:hypothetical protein CB1_001535003 [Camelus ferus]|nr:hypothetical protein CB1_001535003 [Camelus ferus]
MCSSSSPLLGEVRQQVLSPQRQSNKRGHKTACPERHQISHSVTGFIQDCMLDKTYGYVIKASHNFFQVIVIYNSNVSICDGTAGTCPSEPGFNAVSHPQGLRCPKGM